MQPFLLDPEPLIRRVYAYAAYRLGDGPEAEDVTSETFARALRYRESFDETRGDPAAWLIGIARRCIASAATHEAAADAEAHPEVGALDFAPQSDARLDLRRALLSLSPRDRELIALRYGADLTARQIGDLLDLRTNAVEVALHRALGQLRGLLEPRRPQQDAPLQTANPAPLGSDL